MTLVWNNCNSCRQCILKEEKSFIPKQKQYVKKMAHPWSETTAFYFKVDNVYLKEEKNFIPKHWDELWPKQYIGDEQVWPKQYMG